MRHLSERKPTQHPEANEGYCLNSAWHKSSVVMKTVYVRRKSSRRVSAKKGKQTQGEQIGDKRGSCLVRPWNSVHRRNMTNGGGSGRAEVRRILATKYVI